MTAGTRELIDALADGPVAGSALADRLGTSTDAVGALVDELRACGFRIERGEAGYRVADVPEYGLGVAYGLDAPYRVEHHRTIPSTNARARELAGAGERDVVVLADEQTGGRGRRGRTWASPPGGAWLSVLVRPTLPPDRIPLLTLAGAVATARAVRGTGVRAGIKWPNDVLVAGGERKLAGVLTEASTAGGAMDWAIVGIGLNANVDPDRLPPGATSLRAEVGDVNRAAIVRRLLESFDGLRSDPDAILAGWRDCALTPGRRVRVETVDGTLVGTAIDVDGRGALRLRTDRGEVTVDAGDCEHLRPA